MDKGPPCDFILIWLPLQRHHLQIRSHSELLEDSNMSFLGDREKEHKSTHNTTSLYFKLLILPQKIWSFQYFLCHWKVLPTIHTRNLEVWDSSFSFPCSHPAHHKFPQILFPKHLSRPFISSTTTRVQAESSVVSIFICPSAVHSSMEPECSFHPNEIIPLSFQSADIIWASPSLKPFHGTHCLWSKDLLPHGPCQPLWPSLLHCFPRLTPRLSELRFSMHPASCPETLPLLCTPPSPSPPSLTSSENTSSKVCPPPRAPGHLLLSLYHTSNFMVTFEIID